MDNYKFDKNGLELKGTNVTIDDVASPTFAGIRQTEFDLDITCDVIPESEKSGISFYMDEKHHYEVVVEKNENKTYVYSRQTIGCIWQESTHYEINSDKVTLHIKSEPLQYHFFFKDENGHDVFLSNAETRYLSSEVAGGFTGTIIGLFAINENGDGISRFENLSVKHDAD